MATWITLFRVSLIPFFAYLMACYAQTSVDGQSESAYRIAALWVFLIAALSDAVDGFIARFFNQMSPLGALLDPLVDKLLGLVALVSLSLVVVEQEWRIPLWFTAFIIIKDTLILLGCLAIYSVKRTLEVRPNFSGKMTTALIITIIVGALWRPQWFPFDFLIKFTAACALLAFFLYFCDMIRQLKKQSE